MKHCKTGRQFGRVRSQRKALLKSLLSSLIIHGRIETTEAKAKESKSAIDKIITKAKRANGVGMEIVRKVEGQLSKDAINVLVKNIKKFDNRDSGYARVIKLSPRKSDGARMAIIELVDFAQDQEDKMVTAKQVTAKEDKKEEKNDEVNHQSK